MVVVVYSSLILGACFLLLILLNIVRASTFLEEIETNSSHFSSGKGTEKDTRDADILASEMKNNYTSIQEKVRQNGASKQACSTYASTLKFLCLYAVASDQGMYHEPGEKLSRRKGAPTLQKKEDVDSSDVDVMCRKTKVDQNDEEVNQPIRTISCCETAGQKCTYHEDPRSKYLARCHSCSKEKTAYLVECCEKIGTAHTEKTDNQRMENDYKCY